jgi:2-phosphosulfolactate phosphatase
MTRTLEVLFSPAEFEALSQRDLSNATCVVFDVLRATSSMVTALANGAKAIIPVASIPEALGLRERDPAVLLAGERDGLRIRRDLTGSIDFDLGNSPREFTRETVLDRTIVMTTTNGTRALRAALKSKAILVSSLLNLSATREHLLKNLPDHLIVICSGTFEEAALEDTLAAGALCHGLWDSYAGGMVADSALVARLLYGASAHDLGSALSQARNAKRLLGRPDLAPDVQFCLQADSFPSLCSMTKAGEVVNS